MTTGFFYDPLFLSHESPWSHPECPQRLEAILDRLTRTGMLSRLSRPAIDEKSEEVLTSVHIPHHVERIQTSALQAPKWLDPDTYVAASSYAAAKRAADSACSAVDAVVGGTVRNAFCAVRPPGHHAESARAMGFCLFNNAAIAARYAQRRHGLGRIFILDWDVHHGNGTQEIFYEDPTVFYASLHQFPLYPGTGTADEQGAGEGKGATLNLPMKAGGGDREYHDALVTKIAPALKSFTPDLIILSAGFDAHRLDPLAGMTLSTSGFAALTELVAGLADKVCGGRIVSLLEGGYHLEALAESVETHCEVLSHAG